MDKKSNRTDLLAAGRKKLQQYRQKKDPKVTDGKGKDGKGTSSKGGQSQHKNADPNVVSTDNLNVESSLRSDPQIESHSSQPAVVENLAGTSADTSNVSCGVAEEPILDGDIDPPSLELVEAVTPLDHGHDSHSPAGEVEGDASLESTVTMESKGMHEGDQVSIVGVIQEADSYSLTHHDQKDKLEQEPLVFESISEMLAATEQGCDVSSYSVDVHEGDHRLPEAFKPVDLTNVAAGACKESPRSLNQLGISVMDGSSNERALYQQSNLYEEHLTKTDSKVALEFEKIHQPEACTVIELERQESISKSINVECVDDQSISARVEDNSVDLVQLVDVLKRLPESDFRYLIQSRKMADHGNLDVPQSVTADFPQIFQEQFYLASVSKDIFDVQLLEQHKLQTASDLQHHLLVGEMSALNTSLLDLQESNKILAAELDQCRSEREAAICERMEFHDLYHFEKEEAKRFSTTVDELRIKLDEAVGNLSILSADSNHCKAQFDASLVENEELLKNLASSSEQRKKFEEENFILAQDKEVLSGDLLDCRLQLAARQQENIDLNKCLAVLNEEHKKQGHDVHEEFLIQEIERLSTELVVFRDKLSIEHQEYMQVEADLGEAMSRIEQLAEENIILQSSLEIYKAKISEVDGRHIQISSAGMEFMTQMKIADSGSVEASLVKDDAETVIQSSFSAPSDVCDGTTVSEMSPGDTSVVAMKGCLEEAENLMQKLEKATDDMHLHSVSLSSSIGKNAAPGVSKLIQAFESKANVDDTDGNPSTDSMVPSDSYLAAKEQISHLRRMLKTLTQHVEQVDALILEEKVRCQVADVSRGELEVEIESLKSISNNLEVRNIELEVLCGATNQHAHDSEASKTQLENQFDALKRECTALQLQNVELYNKFTTSNSRFSELQVLLKDLRSSSNGVASTVNYELETLHAEMKQNIYAVQRGWKSALSQLHPAVEKLDNLIGSAVSYPPPSESSDSGIVDHLLLSLCAACEVIEKMMLKVETHETLSNSFMQVTDKLHSVNEERSLALSLLHKVSADLVNLLDISSEHFKDSGFHTADKSQQDIMDSDYYEAVVSKVGNLVGELQELKESNKKLYSDLLNRTSEIEELSKYCLDSDTVLKLVLDVKEMLKLQDSEMGLGLDNTPIVLLQSSVLLLMQKFKDAEDQACTFSEECNSMVIELGKLQDKNEQLSTLNLQYENEMLILKESLTQAKNDFDAIQAELLEKTKELEQSDQRVASVREKLSIAVAKGKGLVVQRDSLKHSLAEMSGELEKCSQELMLKDSRILEIEEKLKAYSEAGERMEALESELTYIRNSATALRESFFMKDSTLQRIEEIMEDLELPDHFHSKDIVEKVDWLAKSVAGNSFIHADWDQRSSVGGGSFSDAGLVTDGGKDDVQPTLNPVDDLRRQYDELQTKFYELAEQNDMLEQSLMERNVLVQRWEEILDRINTPPQIRSMEPEERIHWLGTALSEADNHMRSLQQKIEKLENYCESLSSDLGESRRRISELQSTLQAIAEVKDSALSVADDHMKSYQQKIDNLENYSGSLSSQLEASERRISELESSLQVVLHDKDLLSSNLVALTSDHELALHTVAQYEIDLDRLRKDVDVLQESLVEKLANDNNIRQMESELRRLQGLILEVVQDSGTEDDSSDVGDVQCLERLIRKLMSHNREIDLESHVPKEVVQGHVSERDVMVTEADNVHVPVETVADMDEPNLRSTVLERQNVADLRTELAEALVELARLGEENEEYSKKNQFMAIELEALGKKKDELQELLNQEEQKSASLREKLNLAVRKGKSLVQQRDSLKQNVEHATNEIDMLKSEISLRDNSLLESGQKISYLSLQIETLEAFEAENMSLRNRLKETEQHLQHNGQTLSMLLNKLGEIDFGGEYNAHDPLMKLEGIQKMCSELHATTSSFEQDARKSKKAAELLLAELNEVQERNDGLQEELGRAYNEISTLSRERDLADSAKVEALSLLAKLSDERKYQLTEIDRLKFSISEVKKVFFDMCNTANDAFAKDLELLSNVKAHFESCLQHIGEDLVATEDHGGLVSVNKRFKEFWSRSSPWSSEIPDRLDDGVGVDVSKAAEQHLKQLTEAIGEFKERVHSHSMSLRSEAGQFNNAVTTMLGAVDSQRNSLELIKGQKICLESMVNERDLEGAVLRKSISFLYEACCSSITEIKNRKARLTGQSLASGDLRVNLPSLPSFDGGNFNGSSLSSSEECIKSLADVLVGAVKDFVNIEIEDRESRSKEMRSTILDLQKELQEKDIQRERICMELVGQIKEAESTAANCSRDLQSAKNHVNDLENKLEAMGKEQTLLEQRIVELQQGHVSSVALGEKVKAMSTILAAKEQEIEALMHALDEEENQMEALRIKVEELESTVQQKNSDLEHVEASRAKAVKKLSITVSKFDELHRMSEGLLSEIEDLQSQLQDRDSEISFLRKEVTRCTNDVLEATKMSKERSCADINEFLTWLDSTLSHVLMRDAHGVYDIGKNYAECKENLQKDITSVISELQGSRSAAQHNDALLLAERNKVDELSRRKAALELSLNEKELQLNSLQGSGISGLGTSEIVEVEPLVNKWTTPGPSSTSQVRNWRKANSDQVAIAIDTEAGSSGRFEDEDDDKVHGFKSLTTSRFVPKFTRPVSDMIDGLWVSCDRALMRQPAFRLGIMLYWALLHALLASVIV